jgi:hypothetical protein
MNTITELHDLLLAITASPDGRVRVAGGAPGTEDYDEGWAHLDDKNGVWVSWDSGVRTKLWNTDDISVIAEE